ncbi:MAG: SH3 domain-containing protein [Acetobacteraceae bacterium]
MIHSATASVIRASLMALALAAGAPWHAHAAPAPDIMAEAKPSVPKRAAHPDQGTATGYPLPRFVSLFSDDVNMRVGPGFQYPIEWVYKRRHLPVEIEREFNVWRLVRAPDGGRGWVHKSTTCGVRTFIVVGSAHKLRRKAAPDAAVVAVLDKGVIGTIRRCKKGSDWCRVEADGHRGYLPRQDFWGSFQGEAVP